MFSISHSEEGWGPAPTSGLILPQASTVCIPCTLSDIFWLHDSKHYLIWTHLETHCQPAQTVWPSRDSQTHCHRFTDTVRSGATIWEQQSWHIVNMALSLELLRLFSRGPGTSASLWDVSEAVLGLVGYLAQKPEPHKGHCAEACFWIKLSCSYEGELMKN